jgi:hypothetical protein
MSWAWRPQAGPQKALVECPLAGFVNVTGLSMQSTDLAGKRLALLREVVSGLRRLAIMANVDYPAAVQEMGAQSVEETVATFRRSPIFAPGKAGASSSSAAWTRAPTSTQRLP